MFRSPFRISSKRNSFASGRTTPGILPVVGDVCSQRRGQPQPLYGQKALKFSHLIIQQANLLQFRSTHDRLYQKRDFSSSKEEFDRLLDGGMIREAQAVTEQAAGTAGEEDWRTGARVKLFDAWIAYQKSSLDVYKNSVSSTTTNSSPEQERLLVEIVHAAKAAHDLLEQMEPYLGARNVWLHSKNAPDADDVEYHGKILDGTKAPSRGTTTASSKKEVDAVLTSRCDATLTAWARAVRAGHKEDDANPRSFLRSIPQRAQFLLERMEASFEEPNAPGATVQPTLASYHGVLEAWAYSKEHLRGISAERIFAKMSSNEVGTAAALVRPNGESCRLIIWAWALSRDHRAAFTATGHLMKMFRRLECGSGQDAVFDSAGMEPTIDDYHVVLKVWTRSEYVA